jgi:CRISPR/Cas system-associated protein Cas10 (large subunit of type III CRISPR-Cas system)
MAELILAAILFPAGAYTTVERFYEVGKIIYKQIQDYRNAPAIVKKIQGFMRDMYDGEVKTQIEVSEWLSSQRDVDEILKEQVSDLLQQLKHELEAINTTLKASFDENTGELKKSFTFFYRPRPGKSMIAIESWKKDLWNVYTRLRTKGDLLPDPLLLSDWMGTSGLPGTR